MTTLDSTDWAIIEALFVGKALADIARDVNMTTRSLHDRRKAILRKTGCQTFAQLAFAIAEEKADRFDFVAWTQAALPPWHHSLQPTA